MTHCSENGCKLILLFLPGCSYIIQIYSEIIGALLSKVLVTIPPWGLSTAHKRQQEGYDEEELLHMQMTSGEEEQKDHEPEQESWQISRLVSADTFGAGHDTGGVWTGRMKIM